MMSKGRPHNAIVEKKWPLLKPYAIQGNRVLRYSACENPKLTRLSLGMEAFWLPGTCISNEEGTIDRQVLVWSPDSLSKMIDVDRVSLLASYGAESRCSAPENNVAVDACCGELLQVRGIL